MALYLRQAGPVDGPPLVFPHGQDCSHWQPRDRLVLRHRLLTGAVRSATFAGHTPVPLHLLRHLDQRLRDTAECESAAPDRLDCLAAAGAL